MSLTGPHGAETRRGAGELEKWRNLAAPEEQRCCRQDVTAGSIQRAFLHQDLPAPEQRAHLVACLWALGGRMAVILVVEDEEQVRVLAESILQDNGHQTLSAETTEQALALVQADQPIDLLFTDINLAPDAATGLVHAGLSLAQEAVKLRPDLPVLYTTGQGVTDGMKALFVDGSVLLAKPYDLEQLATKVSEMVSKRG